MLNGNAIEIAAYVAQPSLVAELNPQQLASLIGQLEQLKAICWARLISPPVTTKGAEKIEPSRMLKPAEAAEILPTQGPALRRAGDEAHGGLRRAAPTALAETAPELTACRIAAIMVFSLT
jgi:hypothetical protein